MRGGDNWHPVALSNSVEAGSSGGTRLFDTELVLWRDTGGVAHVWEDRCPHRGMKLSFGFVRGDHIACLYHGWQYNGAGHCQYIPAHPDLDVPNTIKVPVYPVQERNSMIWSALSESPSQLSAPSEMTVPLRSVYLDGDIDTVTAAIGSVRLTPFASQGVADTVVDRVTDNLYTVSSGHDRLLIGVQMVSAGRTALHIAISGSPELYEGAGQRHFIDWAIQLRHAVEYPAKVIASRNSVAGAI